MNELALFAGAGGGILGGKLLGWRTVCAVEWEKYPACVLAARQNDGVLPPFPIWDDVQTFDGNPWRGIVDVVSGGFPCQDISAAGKGAGIEGDRSGMWREMARIIGEVRPRYAFIENSPMLVNRGLGTVLADLAKLGFDAEWGVLGAADIGANHKRDRIWVVAKRSGFFPHSQHDRIRRWEQQSQSIEEKARKLAYSNSTQRQGNKCPIGIQEGYSIIDSNNSQPYVGDTEISRLSSCFKGQGERQPWGASIGSAQWWEAEPPLDRVANGMADRVDRLKAIGNGQVPLCATTAWNILNERLANRKYG
jgi:DNA (cytosine-5)-methyltransferase 1